jgi:hypothetical protein
VCNGFYFNPAMQDENNETAGEAPAPGYAPSQAPSGIAVPPPAADSPPVAGIPVEASPVEVSTD